MDRSGCVTWTRVEYPKRFSSSLSLGKKISSERRKRRGKERERERRKRVY